MVISSLPNLLTAWYLALYCPSNHSDINANVIDNLIKHLMTAHELMWRNISAGYAIVWENKSDGSFLQARPTIFINFPNIKHIASLYNRSIAYLAGMKMNHGEKRPPFAI